MSESEQLGAPSLRIARESYAISAVSKSEVMRYLGYQGQELDDELEGRIESTVALCLKLAQPQAALRSFAVEQATGQEIRLAGCTLHLRGQSISEHLAGATQVVLLAATLGAAVDQELRRLSFIDPLEQVIFDAAATTLVERTADAAEARVRAYAAAHGSFTSWRFSPGYGDLSLSCQKDVLAALDASRQLGISLTPTNLMLPTKSVSALVGIHPTPQPGLESSCAICNLADFCTIRAQGRTCRG